jgi:hypothetical protein
MSDIRKTQGKSLVTHQPIVEATFIERQAAKLCLNAASDCSDGTFFLLVNLPVYA